MRRFESHPIIPVAKRECLHGQIFDASKQGMLLHCLSQQPQVFHLLKIDKSQNLWSKCNCVLVCDRLIVNVSTLLLLLLCAAIQLSSFVEQLLHVQIWLDMHAYVVLFKHLFLNRTQEKLITGYYHHELFQLGLEFAPCGASSNLQLIPVKNITSK